MLSSSSRSFIFIFTTGSAGEPIIEFNEQVRCTIHLNAVVAIRAWCGVQMGQFLVPRGRYAMELYPTFMRLVGKTYEFKVRTMLEQCAHVSHKPWMNMSHG
jgi:hypothetical protein